MLLPTTGDEGTIPSATGETSEVAETGDAGLEADTAESAPGDDGEVAEASMRLRREDRPLLPDFTEAASLLSLFDSPLSKTEFLGLSVLDDPGIRDRIEFLSDREDSFVSDLTIGGPDCAESLAAELPLEDPDPFSLELAFPIAQFQGLGIDCSFFSRLMDGNALKGVVDDLRFVVW
jgi:hypothetical protein